jgi:hypothetical protein
VLGAPIEIACPCGHRQSVPASAGGITVECPGCGRNLLVPLADHRGESPSDIAIVERLTGRKFTATSEGVRALAPLGRLALLCVAPLAALGAWLHWCNYWPAGAVYPLVGVFWFAGITIARIGATRSPA